MVAKLGNAVSVHEVEKSTCAFIRICAALLECCPHPLTVG